MEINDALQLVQREGLGEDGLVARIRLGEFPSTQQMEALFAALEVIYKELRGAKVMDRNLALALFSLGFHVQGHVDGTLAKGLDIPVTFVEDGMVKLFLAVESILQDECML